MTFCFRIFVAYKSSILLNLYSFPLGSYGTHLVHGLVTSTFDVFYITFGALHESMTWSNLVPVFGFLELFIFE